MLDFSHKFYCVGFPGLLSLYHATYAVKAFLPAITALLHYNLQNKIEALLALFMIMIS